LITRLQHVGLALESLERFSRDFEKLFGLSAVDLRKDQGRGFQLDARILFPNGCWLHAVQNWNPESRVNRFLRSHGECLEHIALETDDIQGDVAHLRALGVPLFEDRIFDAPDGLEAFVSPGDAIGFTVELIQPHATSWNFDPYKVTNPNVLGLQHIGLGVNNVAQACERFEKLFRIKAAELRTDQHYGGQRDMMIPVGNDRLWLHAVEPGESGHRVGRFMEKHGEGLEHLCIEVADIRKAVWRVKQTGVPLEQNKIYLDRADGFEAFVFPEHSHGFTVELIEPYPNSRGYRPDKPSRLE
jgi:4-hydroxyphenylpyruvate dioxygenase-like putative hemolysin